MRSIVALGILVAIHAATPSLAADVPVAPLSGACQGGQPHPKINDVVVSEPDPVTGKFTVKIYAEHDRAMEIYFRGSRMTPYAAGLSHPRPTVVTLSASCMTQDQELRIVAKGGWYYECSDTWRTTIGAIDPTPRITDVGVDSQYFFFNYEFPYGTSSRDLRMHILPTADHGTVDRTPNQLLIKLSGRRAEFHFDYDGIVRIAATPCNDPAFRELLYVPLPVSDADCEADCQTECPSCVGSPVKTSSGNARVTEVDPIPSVPFLPLKRVHTSRLRGPNAFGYEWRGLFDAWLRTAFESVSLMTEDGAYYAFEKRTDGTYVQRSPGSSASATSLTHDATSGLYTHRDVRGDIERSFSAGRVVRYKQISTARYVDITYDGAGLPVRLTDSWGVASWIITSDPANRLIKSIAVDGRPDLTWTYSYFSSKSGTRWHLKSATSPAGVWRTYGYQFVSGANEYRGLASITDAMNNVIERHSYDSRTRSTSSFGPQGDIQSIAYEQPGRTSGERVTVVTHQNGRVEKHYIRYVAGAHRTVEISGGCPTCSGAGDVVLAYDGSGNVIRRQDGRGYITAYTYSVDGLSLSSEQTAQRPAGCDPETASNRCRQTPDDLQTIELEPTASSIFISHSYSDPVWRDRPTTIQLPSVRVPGAVVTDSRSYDSFTGQTLVHTRTGWTGEQPREEARTTTTLLYDGTQTAIFAPGGAFDAAWLDLPQPRGLRRSVHAPINQGDATSEFVYYPLHPSVPAPWRGRLAASRNALGNISRWEDYDVFGNTGRIIDANGVATTFTYDRLGRLTASTLKAVPGCDTAVDPLCRTDLTTVREYTGAGALLREDDAAGGSVKYEYDSRSRLVAISRGPAANDLRERLEYTYDATSGKQSGTKYLAFEGGTWVSKRAETSTHDLFGRLASAVHADGTATSYEYDAGGNVKAVTDERHTEPNTRYAYDSASRLTTVTQTLGAGSIVTEYEYDLHGNVTAVTDPNGNSTAMSFDDFGQVLRQDSPVTGTARYTYDASGNLLSQTDANGATTTRTYDALGRVLSATASRPGAAAETITWTHDEGPFARGRTSSMTDPTGSTSYAYERRGLLARETRTVGAASYTTRFQYDEHGNRSQLEYPSGRHVDYTYDFAGRPVTVKTGSTTLVAAAAYMPFGPLREIVYGNGAIRRMTFDSRYRPHTNQLLHAGTAIAAYTYAHDAGGNVTQISDDLDGAFNRAFQYDDLSRLTTVNTGAGLWGSGSFSYDAMGNVLSVQRGTETKSFTYQGTTPRLASVTEHGTTRSVSYDAAGNELASGPRRYDYSPRNQLLADGTLRYSYNGNGLRAVTEALRAFGTISGAVVSATDGAPLSGAQVAVSGTSTATVSDKEGRFVLYMPGGNYTLTIARVGYRAQITSTLVLGDGGSVDAGPIELDPQLGFVAGRAVSALDGSPVSGAAISGSGPNASATTDGTGAFRIPLPQGSHNVTVAKNNFVAATRSVSVTAGATTDAGVFSLVPYGVVSGRVMHETTGAPVEGALVTATTSNAALHVAVQSAERGFRPSADEGFSTTTASDGTYVLPLPPGTYRLVISKPNFFTFTTEAISVGSGSTATAPPVQLEPSQVPTTLRYIGPTAGVYDTPVTLAATLVTDAGTPVAGRPVTFNLGDQSAEGVTNESGVATVNMTPRGLPGTMSLTIAFAGDSGHKASTADASLTIERAPAAVQYTGATVGEYGATMTLTATLHATSTKPLAGRTLAFTLGEQTATAVTDGGGSASVTIAPEGLPGATPLSVSFDGDTYYLAAQESLTATIEKMRMTVRYEAPDRGEYGHPMEPAATLTQTLTGEPLAFAALTFSLGQQSVSATTGSDGVATATITPNGVPGVTPINVRFAGDLYRQEATTSATVTIEREETAIVYTARAPLAVGVTETISAVLFDPKDDKGVAGKLVTFAIGSTTATTITDSAGYAVATVTLPASTTGPAPMAVRFEGDSYARSSSTSGSVLLFEPQSFVVWGGNTPSLKMGDRVNFWGHSWSKQVTGGDFLRSADFLGYASSNSAVPQVCQPEARTGGSPSLSNSCWTANPGNASRPPAKIASYISAIVSTSMTQERGTVYGNSAAVVVLQVDAPSQYVPNPGTPVYGTIVEVIEDGAQLFPNLSYTGPATLPIGKAAEVSARLVSTRERRPLFGKAITFSIADASSTSMTSHSGTAAASITVPAAATPTTLVVRFAGDTGEPPSQIAVNVTMVQPAAAAPPTLLSRWLRQLALPESDEDLPVSLGLTARVVEVTTPVTPGARRFSFYSPEMQLLSETEMSSSNAPAVAYEYIWFGGKPVAQIDARTSEIAYYLNDQLGTPVLMLNQQAEVVWRVERTPYGEIYDYRVGAESHQPLGFPGQEYDQLAPDRYYNIFRWYRSGWGRYTQADPFAQPTWWEPNVFAYVRQNPLRSSDPLGLYTVDRSCYTCGPPNYGRVGADVTRMCQNIQRPACRQITRALSLVPAANRGRSEPLDSCLSRRCASSEVTVQCVVNTAPRRDPLYGACGQVSPSDGTITLLQGNSTRYQGPDTRACPFERGMSWVPTLFEEAVHGCGLWQEPYNNDQFSAIFRKLMEKCADYGPENY